MSISKTVFVCQNCGSQSPKWQGKCLDCNAWNTFVEENFSDRSFLKNDEEIKSTPRLLSQISAGTKSMPTLEEVDRVLGGGLVPGGLLLVGGAPGVGKSTLLLQVAASVAKEKKALYVSGEESEFQTKLRAQRLSVESENLLILHDIHLETIVKHVKSAQPALAVIDSIQTLYKSDLSSAPGSVTQVRECAGELLHLSKHQGTTIILVGHITKDGSIAGPRVLEHIVDTVLYLEGESHQTFRILRALKHRFGSTQEVGIFEMTGKGMAAVKNPSNFFLQSRGSSSGSVVVPVLEGQRPLLMELQALVSRSWYGIPKRTATGIDLNRMNMILAVLEKRCGLHLGNSDAYVNVTGALKIDEPAADLAVAAAVFSSAKDMPLDPEWIVFGEIGLGGEVRAVPFAEERVREAARLGFKKAIVPKANHPGKQETNGITLMKIEKIQDAFSILSAQGDIKKCNS